MSVHQGIDYGSYAGSNRNKDTGIRYGVISEHSLSEYIYDVICDGADYGPPTCPKCQRQADAPSAFGETFKDGRPDDYTDEPYECDDYVCVECKHFFGSESAFNEEMIGWSHEADGYKLTDCLSTDVFVIESPYYTYAQFCSPCVPGACSLDSPSLLDDTKCYALGHEWFEDGKAPYRIFKVSDDSEVFPQENDNAKV